MRYLYRTYQLLVGLPLLFTVTVLVNVIVIVGCILGNPVLWGYYPSVVWCRLMCWGFLLPVTVEGKGRLDKSQPCIFVANHQGAFDIFLMNGFLGINFRWMMKNSLHRIPLLGKACEKAGHVFVDKSGPKAVLGTIEQSKKVLQRGISLGVFPEGTRTYDGHLSSFNRGAFQLACRLQCPIVPITIDGSYDVLPRQRGFGFLTWHPLRMIIHNPILPTGHGAGEIERVMEESKRVIMRSLPQR